MKYIPKKGRKGNVMLIMTMDCFCGMVDSRKALSLISSQGHSQRFSPSQISDTPRAGFETVQNLSSGFVEGSCAVVITKFSRKFLHKLYCQLEHFNSHFLLNIPLHKKS